MQAAPGAPIEVKPVELDGFNLMDSAGGGVVLNAERFVRLVASSS